MGRLAFIENGPPVPADAEGSTFSLVLELSLCPCPRIAGSSRYGTVWVNCEETIIMQGQAERAPHANGAAPGADERVLLLAGVDFKWLMAGEGWWVDTSRFQTDPAYAAGFLRLAMASPSSALRECAAALQAQLGGPAACDAGQPGT